VSLACPPPDANQAVAERLADYLDCHAQALGQSGFEALSGGWLGPALLGGCLTIYVALIGYRLILRRPFGPRQALMSALRAGVVIAFASHWSGYEAVVYRVAIAGPAEAASKMLSRSELPALSLPEAARRLDRDLAQLQPTTPAAAAPSPPAQAASSQPGAQPTPAPSQSTPAPQPMKTAGLVLMISTLGSLAAVRFAAGVLLAAGPLFITIALFDTTLGVFEGWAGALVATFFAAIGATLVAALEIDFLDSQLAQAELSPGPQPVLDEPGLMMTALLFGAGFLAVLGASALIGRGFRIVTTLQTKFADAAWMTPGRSWTAAAPKAVVRSSPEPTSRAHNIAEAVLRLGRRERNARGASAAFAGSARAHEPAVAHERSAAALAPSPGPRRRSVLIGTTSAKRRDGLK
jgi:type IV secretion system protein VirB6